MGLIVRAAIEDEYSRKLLALCRKSLGAGETGSLRSSLDVVRTETESIGKAHAAIAGQMKQELEEPLTAFAGGSKERRKIIQNGIERLLKTKIQQTQLVNKVRRGSLFTSGDNSSTNSTTDSGSLRTGLPENQGIPRTGTHGDGSRGTEEQGETRENANPARI